MKKAQFLIPMAIFIGFIVIAGVIFFSQQTKGQSEERAREDTTTQPATPPDDTRDDNPSTPEQPSTPENTPVPEKLVSEMPICSYTGEWEALWVKERTNFDVVSFGNKIIRSKALAVFKYTGNCVADIYLEAGITPETKQPLSLAPIAGTFPIISTPSWCDGNVNYYGHLFKGVKPGQKLLGVDFKPQTPMEEGAYTMTVGAYLGCINPVRTDRDMKKSDVIVLDDQFTIRISNQYSEDIGGSASNSWVKVR